MPIVGSSAGSEDLTPAFMEELGEMLVHGVTVMTGKPALLAAVDGRPVVGIPGYPVSAEEEKNGCVILVKRFIDIPPYSKWNRGTAFHKCKDTIARLLSGVLNMHPSGGDIRKL
jgi:putative molybdopterin biosynthesis protein